MVTLKFHLNLIKYSKSGKIIKNTEKPILLADLLNEWGIPFEEIGLIFINGKWDTINCTLNPGDSVDVYPFLSGG
jgi:hypothetical protein